MEPGAGPEIGGSGGCTVQQVVYGDGTTSSAASVDPIVGAAVSGPGKLVYLDPEQQMVSQIFGFAVAVAPSGGGSGFTGAFRAAPFADLWVRFPAGQPDSFFGAFYQSVLQAISLACGRCVAVPASSRPGDADPAQHPVQR